MTPYCAEGCGQPATTERPEGLVGDTLLVILTCDAHGPEWLRP